MEARVNAKRRTIGYDCPRCGGELESPFDEAGTSQHCPLCQAGVEVPGREKVEALLRKRQQEAEEARKLVEENEKRAANEERARARQRELIAEDITAVRRARAQHAGAKDWGGALQFVGFALIILGAFGLIISFILLFETPQQPSSYSSLDVQSATIKAEVRRAQVISGIVYSLGTIFCGCAFVGFGHVLLLLRAILLRLNESGSATPPTTIAAPSPPPAG